MIDAKEASSIAEQIKKIRLTRNDLENWYFFRLPNPEAIDKYIALSKLVPLEPKHLPMTPYAANAALEKGEITKGPDNEKDQNDRILLDAPMQQWESDIIQEMWAILDKYYDAKLYLKTNPDLKYESVKPEQYPAIDAIRNFFKMGREVTPGSEERRRDTVLKKHEYVFRPDPRLFRKALEIVQQYLCKNRLHPDEVFTTVTGKIPFSNYHTNVGHNLYANDQTIINGKKAQEIVLDQARAMSLDEIWKLPCVIFGRDQRGGFEYEESSGNIRPNKFKDSKARVVTGTSRVGNYYLSRKQS